MAPNLGSMRVTEQIDAMEVSGTKPFKYLCAHGYWPLLLLYLFWQLIPLLLRLLGGYLNVAINEGTSYTTFMEQVFEPLTFFDFVASLIKSIVFGFTIGIVGCYQGYYSNKGTEGVGKAANGAVVTAMFLVLLKKLLLYK